MTDIPEDVIEAALDMWSDHPYWRSRPTAKTLRLCMSRALAAADAAWEKRGWKRVHVYTDAQLAEVAKEAERWEKAFNDAAPVTRKE